MNIDDMNFFLAQSKGIISKMYNFAIWRQFVNIKHPSFDNRWIKVFKWEDRTTDLKV